MRRATIYVAGAALLAGVTAAILTATREHEELRAVGHPAVWAFVLLIGWSFIGSGIVAAARGLGSRFGALMIGAGFAWFAAALSASGEPVLFTIGTLLASLWIAIFVHALMAFPGGRLEISCRPGSGRRVLLPGGRAPARLAHVHQHHDA